MPNPKAAPNPPPAPGLTAPQIASILDAFAPGWRAGLPPQGTNLGPLPRGAIVMNPAARALSAFATIPADPALTAYFDAEAEAEVERHAAAQRALLRVAADAQARADAETPLRLAPVAPNPVGVRLAPADTVLPLGPDEFAAAAGKVLAENSWILASGVAHLPPVDRRGVIEQAWTAYPWAAAARRAPEVNRSVTASSVAHRVDAWLYRMGLGQHMIGVNAVIVAAMVAGIVVEHQRDIMQPWSIFFAVAPE